MHTLIPSFARRSCWILGCALTLAGGLSTAQADGNRGPSDRSGSSRNSGDSHRSGSHADYDRRGADPRSYHREPARPVYRPTYYPRYYPYARPVYGHPIIWPSFSLGIGYERTYVDRVEVVEVPRVVEREVVVERPVVRTSVPPARNDELVAVWLGDQRYLLKDGAFFKPTSEGLVWVPNPVGAIIKHLPIGATTVWHEDNEYFEFDKAYFRRSPEGFKVVDAPWAKRAPQDAATAQESASG